jgi:D-beta-D-heptose 7-phosphate kinase/D-beta-D-heptose 1-phosphate adenosyltransferase
VKNAPYIPDKHLLIPLVRSLKGRRVTVIGDVMLDVYLHGKVARISPEAPIPVVEIDEKDRLMPGGAANVASNIAALGGKASLVGVVGDDRAGRAIAAELRRAGVDVSGLVVVKDRPTTEKTRVIAHTQQVVRVDREVKSPLSRADAARVTARALASLRRADAVVYEDYNKGVLTRDVIRRTLAAARRGRKIVTVDPKFKNFFEFRGATVVKPNLKEVREALGSELADREDLSVLGAKLMKRLDCRSVVITLGEAGMALFERKHPLRTIPTMAREVYDVSGAGDTVIATLTLGLAAGADLLSSCTLANYAAGIEVGKLGVATVTSKELIDRLMDDERR